MSAVRTAAGALLRSRDRATSVLTVAAFALPHAFLLAVTGGVMAFGSRAAVAATSATADDPATLDGMASFYVILAYFAATLLIVPIISMGAAAARLGMSRRERDLAVLRLVGLAPGKTKLACILETCVFAAVGVVVGSILYAVTLPDGGRRDVGGGRCPPRRGARHDPPGRPVLVVWLSVGTVAMSLGTAIGMAVFMGFMGAIFLIINLVGIWSISLMGRIMASVARTPQMMVARRRMADDPRAVWRSFGAVALVGFLMGIMYPASSAISMSGDRTDEVALVVIVALGSALAGVVLIVAASAATVPLRRRILASVREGRE